MIEVAIGLFATAALLGAYMALGIFKNQLPAWGISLAHAGLGASGLLLLVGLVFSGDAVPRVTQALLVLVVAALGGFYLASFHFKGKLPPKAVVLIHAVVAALGLILLLTRIL